MADFNIKQKDLKPVLSAYLTDVDGNAINLTTADGVKLVMRKRNSAKTIVVDAAASVIDAATGAVSYQWLSGDTNDVGLYNAIFEVDWDGSIFQSFPADGYLKIEIQEDLGGDI